MNYHEMWKHPVQYFRRGTYHTFLFNIECVSACECDDDLVIQACNASTKCSSMCHAVTVIKRISAKPEINKIMTKV